MPDTTPDIVPPILETIPETVSPMPEAIPETVLSTSSIRSWELVWEEDGLEELTCPLDVEGSEERFPSPLQAEKLRAANRARNEIASFFFKGIQPLFFIIDKKQCFCCMAVRFPPLKIRKYMVLAYLFFVIRIRFMLEENQMFERKACTRF